VREATRTGIDVITGLVAERIVLRLVRSAMRRRAEAGMLLRRDDTPTSPRRWRRRAALGAALVTVLACRPDGDDRLYDAPSSAPSDRAMGRRAPSSDGVSVGIAAVPYARFVETMGGLRNPESVRYDPDQDVYFISNMSGFGSVKDGDGYIVRANAADVDQSSVFVRGGSGGVTLDAPKGMAISGDTLWVADIDKLRAFHRVTGAPLTTVDFAPLGAVLLNDVAVGPTGELRVTDTGIRMTEIGVYFVGPARIFALGPDGTIRTVAEGSAVGQPNGIAWDSNGNRWIVVSFDRFRWDVRSIGSSGSVDSVFSRARQGQLDGVEVLSSGTILYSSWADSSLHLLEGGRDVQVIREVRAPADIGFDTRRNRVAIPMPTMGWVQLWSLDPIDR
jgi:sugar lactone lactonase YvrE